VAVVDHHAEVAVDGDKFARRQAARAADKPATVDRYVCISCGGVYFNPVNDHCPGCHGAMEIREVWYDASGVAHVKTD